MKVSELKAKTGKIDIELEIVSVAEPREFTNNRGSGKVANAAAKDDTGEVVLTLWGEQADMLKEGDKIKIENGWCSEYNGQLQLSTGKFGTLTKLE